MTGIVQRTRLQHQEVSHLSGEERKLRHIWHVEWNLSAWRRVYRTFEQQRVCIQSSITITADSADHSHRLLCATDHRHLLYMTRSADHFYITATLYFLSLQLDGNQRCYEASRKALYKTTITTNCKSPISLLYILAHHRIQQENLHYNSTQWLHVTVFLRPPLVSF